MSKYFFLIFFSLCSLYSQIETHKWNAEPADFSIKQIPQKEYNLVTDDLSSILVSSAQIIYYKLFSEYDGDNCPFHPSCSSFFVQAVQETNILKGSLMFADRFTRDLNLFKGFKSYPIHSSGKFYDPSFLYALQTIEKIVQLEKSADD